MSMDTKKIRWMQMAFREAEKAFESEEVPIGAIIVITFIVFVYLMYRYNPHA